MTFVNKILYVSGVQFYNTSSYIVLCVHYQVIYPTFTSSISPIPVPSGTHHTVVCVYEGYIFLA